MMLCNGWVRKIVLCAYVLAAHFALGSAATAQEGYELGPGDTLRISIADVSKFDRELTIGLGGSVAFPLIGLVPVSGRTIDELQAEIPVLFSGVVYRERLRGEEILVSLTPEDVFLEVLEYRPVYVDGLVREPGQVPFSAGLTVRQAIAYSKGVGLPLTAATSNRMDVAAFRTLSNQLVALSVDIARLRATADFLKDVETADGPPKITVSAIDEIDAGQEVKANFVDLANDRLAAFEKQLRSELQFASENIDLLEKRILSSLRQQETLTEIVASEEEEVRRQADLVERRLASSDILAQAKRTYLQAIERLRIVQLDISRLEQDRRLLVRNREALVEERMSDILAELRDLEAQAAQVREELGYLNGDNSGVPRTDGTIDQGGLKITIYRQENLGMEEIQGEFGSILMPGDVVYVDIDVSQ